MSGLARIRFKTMKEKVSEYVMVAEAADILGVSQGTVRSWAAAGKIPMHKNPANGYRLFRRSDLETFLKRIAKRVSISTISQ
jgi:excisionase family DNA binding protein